MKVNKYIYLYVLQCKYSNWCDEFTFSDEEGYSTVKDRKAMLKCYRDNAPQYEYRVIKRREINPNYKADSSNRLINSI